MTLSKQIFVWKSSLGEGGGHFPKKNYVAHFGKWEDVLMTCDHFENVIFLGLPCCRRLANPVHLHKCNDDGADEVDGDDYGADDIDGDDDDNGGWLGGRGRGRMC